MKTILTTILQIVLIFQCCIAQTTTINFRNGNFYDPNFWNNGGCATYKRFGPNPILLNDHNVRTVGSTLMLPVFRSTETFYQLSLYAFTSETDGSGQSNAIVSIEYPFKSNKSYTIEIEGLNDHSWNGGNIPVNHYNGVFWVQLDNSPEITTQLQNKCESSYTTTIQRKVGRYTKLISDPAKAIVDKIHTVKFSPLEDKNALKIIFDAVPQDPNLVIDNIFRLTYVRITEIPYENDLWQSAVYKNVPRPPRGTPGYDIETEYLATGRPNRPTRPTTKSVTILPENWILDYSGVGHSVYLTDLIPNMNFGEIISVSVLGNYYQDPRDGTTRRARLNLPVSFDSKNFTYSLANDQLIVSVDNVGNTRPDGNVEIEVVYK